MIFWSALNSHDKSIYRWSVINGTFLELILNGRLCYITALPMISNAQWKCTVCVRSFGYMLWGNSRCFIVSYNDQFSMPKETGMKASRSLLVYNNLWLSNHWHSCQKGNIYWKFLLLGLVFPFFNIGMLYMYSEYFSI